jgi:para-nitrobenzyl esterase
MKHRLIGSSAFLSMARSHGFAPLCLLLLAGGAPIGPAMADEARSPDGPVVRTAYGPVRGFTRDAAMEFLGIPFAAPPVGELRWRPPEPAARWEEPRSATGFASHCPQVNTYDGFNTPSTTEDCLYLNVFAPLSSPGRGHGHGRPVMVWIYGGGFSAGESDDYDGSKLATQGNVVVVTVNYRIGVLGIFAHPALSAEGHLVTNYGLLDQQFALQWVRANIAAFGGDPDNVTIFGESAGAVSVYFQLASPLAHGLFQRAIAESGSFNGLFKSRPEAAAEVIGQAFATQAGCSDQTAACLRSLSVTQILANQPGHTIQPVMDGTILPQSLDKAFMSGEFNRVPMIHGTNHDEFRWIVGLGFDLAAGPQTASGYASVITAAYGASAPLVAAQYPLANYPSADLAQATLQTDANVACPGIVADDWFSAYVPTYAYEFADPDPPIYLPAVSFPWGASHTTEIQFLFPGYHGGQGLQHPLNAAEQELSDTMVGYWTRFAASGDPNSDASPRWPRFVAGQNDVQSLLPPSPMTSRGFVIDHNCAFWTSILGWPGSL